VRAQWLNAGLQALRKGGVGAVRVERLAADVGVTKGSFYHHFRDRGALLEEVLDYWAREPSIRSCSASRRCVRRRVKRTSWRRWCGFLRTDDPE
jgi:AcrR family transcriptional regulator